MKFQGEIYRVAGDAAAQKARAHASKHAGSVAAVCDRWSYQGIRPCVIVFRTQANALAAIAAGGVIL